MIKTVLNKTDKLNLGAKLSLKAQETQFKDAKQKKLAVTVLLSEMETITTSNRVSLCEGIDNLRRRDPL